MTKIRIVAAVVDTRRLTLYREDGTTLRIPQGDPRLQRILDDSKDDLLAGRVAEVDISKGPQTTAYNDFEKQTGGLVRFFKVAKNKISNLFTGEQEAGPAPSVPNTYLGKVTPGMSSALAQIMAHAVPATDDAIKQHETVVAVVDNKPIPGVEKLHKQFTYANKMTSTKGMQAFLSRIAKVIEQRNHSVDELLMFLQKADLPIADDGSIIIYKVLRRASEKGKYVDCHSRKVVQQLGSFVCMDEKLVDPSRRLECSTGLHVARRSYLGSFPGDVCTLGKVAPEDIIAVPHGEPDKMRVCGYHLLFELSSEMFSALKRDQAMTGSKDGQKLLAKAISGNHEPPMEEVRIGGAKGTNVTITPLNGKGGKQPRKSAPRVRRASAIDLREPEKEKAPDVDPKAVSKQVAAAKTLSRSEAIQAHLDRVADENGDIESRIDSAQRLLDLRKAAKKSWAGLGHPRTSDENLKNFINSMKERQARAVQKAKEQAAAKNREKFKSTVKTESIKGKTKPNGSSQTVNERARQLFNGGDWSSLELFKSQKKKGWAALGFSASEIAKIERNI